MSVQIYPSILSADFCDLKNELNTISTADGIHIDVMDYHFVPNHVYASSEMDPNMP